ncbi:MFS transporter [Nonomuraea sediminis]|uniref:MFS transporter n=1 Tax=Nonomuraea sediminis TaxID=2835864 RepID=UPI001BDD7478|nr:MFS transporter [Nonomuraea sediminis]
MRASVVAGGRGGLVLVVVGLAGFITTLDNTVVTVALPSIQRDLGAGLAALEWVATGYIVAFGGLMLAGGRLADVYGRRRMLLAGMTLFTGASLAAGLATSIQVLVAARVAQGVGAALVLPATLAVLAGREDRDRSAGVAVWMASGAAALALGPVVGGYLSQHAHWSWIFLLNAPFGATVITLAALTLPTEPPRARAPTPPDSLAFAGMGGPTDRHEFRPTSGVSAPVAVDVPGVVASGVVLGAGTFALIHGGEYGWGSVPIGVAVGVCVVGAGAFVVVERVAREPMVDLRLFASRGFTGGVLAQVLWGLGVNGVFFYTALFLQEVLGFTPTGSGMAFVPLAMLVVLVTPVVPVLERAIGAGRTVGIGLVLVAAGMLAAAFLGPGDGWERLVPAVGAIGVGSALTIPLGSAVLAGVPESRAGVAGGVFSVSREISGLFGIAAVGAVVQAAGSLATGYRIGLLAAATLVLAGAAISTVMLPRGADAPAAAQRLP